MIKSSKQEGLNCALRLDSKRGQYYRHAGDWSIQAHYVDGVLVFKGSGNTAHMKGMEAVEVTEEQWREDNAPYANGA